MSSDRPDFWAGIGAIASSIVSVYAWLYSIGLVPLFTFITGALFTLWTQERLEKGRRKRDFNIKMSELIYGPLHKELSSMFITFKAFQSPSIGSLENIMKDFRFNLVKEELRYRIKEFQEKIYPYSTLLNTARGEAQIHVKRDLNKHEIEQEVSFDLRSGTQDIFRVAMIRPIFRDKTPFDFLTEKGRLYRDTHIIVYVGTKSEGLFSSEHRIHQISMDILKEVREDPLVQEQRREREHLLKECNSLIESIEKKIVL